MFYLLSVQISFKNRLLQLNIVSGYGEFIRPKYTTKLDSSFLILKNSQFTVSPDLEILDASFCTKFNSFTSLN